jgi:hypothetical protein
MYPTIMMAAPQACRHCCLWDAQATRARGFQSAANWGCIYTQNMQNMHLCIFLHIPAYFLHFLLHIRCISSAYNLHIFCIFSACFLHILAYFVHISAYKVHIRCIFFAYVCIFSSYSVHILCILSAYSCIISEFMCIFLACDCIFSAYFCIFIAYARLVGICNKHHDVEGNSLFVTLRLLAITMIISMKWTAAASSGSDVAPSRQACSEAAAAGPGPRPAGEIFKL